MWTLHPYLPHWIIFLPQSNAIPPSLNYIPTSIVCHTSLLELYSYLNDMPYLPPWIMFLPQWYAIPPSMNYILNSLICNPSLLELYPYLNDLVWIKVNSESQLNYWWIWNIDLVSLSHTYLIEIQFYCVLHFKKLLGLKKKYKKIQMSMDFNVHK